MMNVQGSAMFYFREDERLFFADIRRAVGNDQQGREVLVGLTLEETEFYVGCLRRRAEPMPNETDIRRFFGLHEKHEQKRGGVVDACGSGRKGNAVELLKAQR